MKVFGIDVSRWQGNFDFKKAKKEGVEFAIIKAGGSDGGYYKDPKFERNYKEAKNQGLNVGAYYFCTLTSVNDAKNEAKHFLECIKGKKYELPVYVDVEHSSSKKTNKKVLTDSIIEFCSIMEKNGYFCGIYSSKSFFETYMQDSRLQKYAHWVAQWTKKCTYQGNDGVFGMWQFGGETNLIRSNKVAGQVCDQNYMLVDYPTMIKNAGKNGFSKTTKEEPKVEPKVESKKETKPTISYYKKYSGKSSSIVDALNSIGVNSSFINRTKIARKNGISIYIGSSSQNIKLLNLLKQGKLVK